MNCFVRWNRAPRSARSRPTDEHGGYGHQLWARDDMLALGAPPDLLDAPPPAHAILYGRFFVDDAGQHPYAILDAKGVLEHLSSVRADHFTVGG